MHFFFYNKLKNPYLLNKINKNFQIKDSCILVKKYNKDLNFLEIDNNSSKNTELLEGKLVYFDMDNNDVITKINNIKECKTNNKNKIYKLDTIITINSDGTKNTANIIY